MIAELIDRIAYWWLDHRTQPTDPNPGVGRASNAKRRGADTRKEGSSHPLVQGR